MQAVPLRTGELLIRVALPSLLRERLLPEEFPLGSKQWQQGGWDDVSEAKLFFLPFPCGYSQVVGSIELLWSPELF